MKIKILTLILIFYPFSFLFSQTSWTGDGDQVSFTDPNNWDNGTPVTNSTVVFDNVDVTITDIPAGFFQATPLADIIIINNSNVTFDNSGFNAVDIYTQNLNIDETSSLSLRGTDLILIYTENADISGTMDAGEIHIFGTYNTGTVDFQGTAHLITANVNGFSDSFQGAYGFTTNFPNSIKYNGSADQSTGLFNISIFFEKIIIENPSNLHADNFIETDSLELIDGNFEIGSNNLTVNKNIDYQNGLLAGNSSSSLIFGDGSGNQDEYFLMFDNNADSLSSLTINMPDAIVTLESDLVIGSSLDLSGGKLRVVNNIELLSNTTVSGSEVNYILTNSEAYVNINIPAVTSDTIPLGTENSYAPVVINPAAADVFSVSVHDGIFSEGDYGTALIHNNVNLRWEIYPSTNTSYDLSLQWNIASEIGTIDFLNCYISNFNGIDWSNSTGASVSATGSYNTAGPVTFTNASGFFGVFWGTNELPTTSDNEVITKINTVYVFNTDDFNYSDPDADAFAKIMIEQEPTKGNLFLDLNHDDYVNSDEYIFSNDQILIEDIMSGLLKFAPVTDSSGIPYTNFLFSVSDGLHYSNPPPAAISIIVSDNHPPEAPYDQTFTLPEHSPDGTVAGKIEATDPDGDNIYFYPQEGVVYSDAFQLADDGTISVSNSSLLEYSVNPTFIYNIDVCDDNNYILCTPVRVTIKLEQIIRDLVPANYISPNGDGHNDRWLVKGLENDIYEAFIFNGNGKLLFYSADYKNGWEGTSRGRELPPGVYYYLLKSKNTEKTGTITLVR